MALAAVDAVDDAIDATKRFLLPFSWGTWLRLAFVLFFVGGGGGGISNIQSFSQFGQDDFSGGGIDDPGAQPDPGAAAGSGPEWLTPGLILGVIAAVVLLALVLWVVGEVMQFVFVDSLIREEVHVRRYFRRHVGNGLRLAGFRLLLGIVAVLMFGVVGIGTAALVFGLSDPSAVGPAMIPLLLLFLLVFAMVFGTINGFTNVFVVPVMITEDRGVFSAWGRLWGAIKREWREFLAYLFFSVVLMLGIGILAAFASVFAALAVGIPLGIVGYLIWTAASGTVMLVGVGVVVALFVLLFLIASQLIAVPLQSFLRYYALLVLGDVDEDMDPVPEMRAAVRSDEAAAT